MSCSLNPKLIHYDPDTCRSCENAMRFLFRACEAVRDVVSRVLCRISLYNGFTPPHLERTNKKTKSFPETYSINYLCSVGS